MLNLDAIRERCGRVLIVEQDGRAIAFRPFSVDQAKALVAAAERTPDLAFQLGLAALRGNLEDGAEDFEALLEATPLVFDYAPTGVLGRMLELASEDARKAGKDSIRTWRESKQDLAKMANNLLAFKAYSGGTPSPAAFAGAIHVAEAVDGIKALFKLHSAFMNALGKR